MSNPVYERIQSEITDNPVMLYMKGNAMFPQCGFSGRAVNLLRQAGVTNLVTVNVLEDEEVRQAIKEFSNWPTIPQLYIGGEFIGGSDIVAEMASARTSERQGRLDLRRQRRDQQQHDGARAGQAVEHPDGQRLRRAPHLRVPVM